MTDTPLKDMARHRKLKAGHFVFEFDTPGIGHILKQAGCDFTIFDTEHSGLGIETTRSGFPRLHPSTNSVLGGDSRGEPSGTPFSTH